MKKVVSLKGNSIGVEGIQQTKSSLTLSSISNEQSRMKCNYAKVDYNTVATSLRNGYDYAVKKA